MSIFSIRPVVAFICICLFSGASIMTPAHADPAKIRIAFEGDSMVDGLWEGMERYAARDACLKHAFEFGRFAKNSTGLTRVDKFNWPEESHRIEGSFAPDLVVIMVGLNDRQSVIAADHTHANWGAADWPKKYAEQVHLFLDAAAAAPYGVMWAGLPVLRDPESNLDVAEKNKLYAGEVASFHNEKLEFVSPWRLNPTGEETYKSTGPDLKGSIVQLRLTDGEHFTTAGHDLLGAYLFPKVLAHLAALGVKLPDDCAKQ